MSAEPATNVQSASGGGEIASYPRKWRAVVEHQFDSESLLGVLADYAHQLDEGTFVTEVAKVLERERTMGAQMAILLEAMTKIRQTVRVDGLMPFNIPVPTNIFEPVETLLEEVRRMHYAVPESGEERARLLREVSVCILGCLHGREFQIDHRLIMRVQLECPYSPNLGRKDTLMLMGYLPFGGRVTVFYSSLRAAEWLDMEAGAVEHEDALDARRHEGRLRLFASKKDQADRRLDRYKIF